MVPISCLFEFYTLISRLTQDDFKAGVFLSVSVRITRAVAYGSPLPCSILMHENTTFIHSTVDGCLGCFQFWSIMHFAILVCALLLDTYVRVELLGYRLVTCPFIFSHMTK